MDQDCVSTRVEGIAIARALVGWPLTPNPSIEGMPKRLRLLCTPHVKR
jgi:hypothetical protein